MALRPVMTWEPGKRRWRKMHKGKVYTVSCETLGCPPTKEASYRAADAWWRSRVADLTPRHPHADVLRDLDRKIAWSEQHEPETAVALRDFRESVADDTTGEVPTWGVVSEVGKAVWNDRLQRDDTPAAPGRITVGQLAQQWIDIEHGKASEGLIKPRSYTNNKVNCLHFSTFVGESLAPTVISETTVDNYYTDLLRKVAEGLSPSNARERMKVAVRFLKWLWERRAIELPRNLDKSFKFGVVAPVIVTFTREEVRTLLDTATGQNRLHVLLMLNCGMYPGDLASLQDNEVDWSAGTITRKRTKTQTHATVPTVTYTLWSETARLLREHRSGKPTVLLNGKGKPWIRESVRADGSISVSDTLSVSLDALMARSKIEKPIKSLRKTGASLLESRPEFARFGTLYLGHAPRGMAEKHYTAPDSDGFAKALRWLGEQFGL